MNGGRQVLCSRVLAFDPAKLDPRFARFVLVRIAENRRPHLIRGEHHDHVVRIARVCDREQASNKEVKKVVGIG